MPARDLWIDRLRSVMTALVLLHHTAITYGAEGGWFHYELKPSGTPSSQLLTLFSATNQAYFMGFFFLLAGYFTPRSLEHKGYLRFLGDRLLRLGIPMLGFIVLLGPLTAAVARYANPGFRNTLVYIAQHGIVIVGPLWFAEALLFLSFGYCAWRLWLGAPLATAQRTPRPVPGFVGWLAGALFVGAAALAIRQFVPTGKNIFGLQLGYFSSYIFLFALGIAAWRYDWLRQLRWQHARPWILGLALTWPIMPAAILLARTHSGSDHANFSGGFSWPAIFYACWEPFVAWGLIAAWILVFRARMDTPSRLWNWLNRRAYAVYVIHPPILVSVSLLLHSWVAPALVKFAVAGSLTCVFAWLLADPLVRLPGLRRVL